MCIRDAQRPAAESFFGSTQLEGIDVIAVSLGTDVC